MILDRVRGAIQTEIAGLLSGEGLGFESVWAIGTPPVNVFRFVGGCDASNGLRPIFPHCTTLCQVDVGIDVGS